jgi:hypothetical protein
VLPSFKGQVLLLEDTPHSRNLSCVPENSSLGRKIVQGDDPRFAGDLLGGSDSPSLITWFFTTHSDELRSRAIGIKTDRLSGAFLNR